MQFLDGEIKFEKKEAEALPPLKHFQVFQQSWMSKCVTQFDDDLFLLEMGRDTVNVCKSALDPHYILFQGFKQSF